MMKEAILDDSPHRDIRLNDVFNKITDIWQHQNSVTTGSKPTMTCDVIESVRSDLNEPISHDEESPGGHPLEISLWRLLHCQKHCLVTLILRDLRRAAGFHIQGENTESFHTTAA
uniref:Uncharacterized protein n=1 Tax=Cacopsylla melanoneura TaxID=428564 RepID=A0A8D9AGM7_9HEMI